MFSTIITGGNENSRDKKVNQIRESLSVRLNSPDLIVIDEENSIGIDKVREIKSKTKYTSLQDPNKLIILKNADKLTPEAQNALLKILEEPPTKTYFILLANSNKSFLPTVASRCQIINLPAVDPISVNEKDLEGSFVWEDILNSTNEKHTLSLALTNAEKISAFSFPSKNGALEYVDKQIQILRKLIPGTKKEKTDNLPKITTDQAVIIIRLLCECQNNINSNVNVRQCLESLFIKASLIS